MVRSVYVNAAIEGFDFHLEPIVDLRPVSVANPQDTPKGTLLVDVLRGSFDRLSIDVPLDADGVGMLPRSLKGADLRISLGDAYTNVANWDGGALFVELDKQRK